MTIHANGLKGVAAPGLAALICAALASCSAMTFTDARSTVRPATITAAGAAAATDAIAGLAAARTSSRPAAPTALATPGTGYHGACADAVTGDAGVTGNCLQSAQIRVREPQPKTFSITGSARAAEGASASLTITLGEDAPAAGVAFTVVAGFSGSSTAEAEDVMPIDSPVTVPGGTRTLSIAIPLTDDDIEEDEETFTITIATTAEGWMKQGDGKDTAVVTIDDDDNAGVNYSGVDRGWHIGRIIVHQQTPQAYQVVLTSRPVADVTIKVSASFWNRVSPASHTFVASSANDWREPKEFTVTAGPRIGAAVIMHTVISADPNYSPQDTDWFPPSDKLQLTVRPPLPTRLTLRADRVPAEGGGAVTVTATLDNPAPLRGTTVRLTPSGTATGGGVDYTLSSTTISIAEIETTGTTTITVTDDRANDDGETIWLDAASTNPPLTAPRLALTIADND